MGLGIDAFLCLWQHPCMVKTSILLVHAYNCVYIDRLFVCYKSAQLSHIIFSFDLWCAKKLYIEVCKDESRKRFKINSLKYIILYMSFFNEF